MDTVRPPSRGRSQPSVRWANSRSPSRSPSRGFRTNDYRADPTFAQVSHRDPTPSHSHSSKSRSRSRGPSTDRAPYPYPYPPADTMSEPARSQSRFSSAKSWIDDNTKIRDENGKVVKSSLAVLGAIGAAAYVAHRTIPKIIPGSHEGDGGSTTSTNSGRRSSSRDRHDVDDRRPRRRHHGERVERHHRYASFYDDEVDAPPRAKEAYYDVRSDLAEPAWSRQSTTNTTKYIDLAPPRGVPPVQPGFYKDDDDQLMYVDAEGRQYMEEYRSGRFWPGGRLP